VLASTDRYEYVLNPMMAETIAFRDGMPTTIQVAFESTQVMVNFWNTRGHDR
jgi:hypothetical protein